MLLGAAACVLMWLVLAAAPAQAEDLLPQPATPTGTVDALPAVAETGPDGAVPAVEQVVERAVETTAPVARVAQQVAEPVRRSTEDVVRNVEATARGLVDDTESQLAEQVAAVERATRPDPEQVREKPPPALRGDGSAPVVAAPDREVAGHRPAPTRDHAEPAHRAPESRASQGESPLDAIPRDALRGAAGPSVCAVETPGVASTSLPVADAPPSARGPGGRPCVATHSAVAPFAGSSSSGSAPACLAPDGRLGCGGPDRVARPHAPTRSDTPAHDPGSTPD